MALSKFGFLSDKSVNKEESDGKTDRKRKYEEKQKCQFYPKWKIEFPWLELDEEEQKRFTLFIKITFWCSLIIY